MSFMDQNRFIKDILFAFVFTGIIKMHLAINVLKKLEVSNYERCRDEQTIKPI